MTLTWMFCPRFAPRWWKYSVGCDLSYWGDWPGAFSGQTESMALHGWNLTFLSLRFAEIWYINMTLPGYIELVWQQLLYRNTTFKSSHGPLVRQIQIHPNIYGSNWITSLIQHHRLFNSLQLYSRLSGQHIHCIRGQKIDAIGGDIDLSYYFCNLLCISLDTDCWWPLP